VTTAVLVILLFGYWALMVLVPVPGFGAGDLGKEGNLAAYLDRAVLGSHIWRAAKVYDPEGILSTLPAVATTLAGVLTGLWLRAARTLATKAAAWRGWGRGRFRTRVGRWFPQQQGPVDQLLRRLHGGAALLILAACFWLVRSGNAGRHRSWSSAPTPSPPSCSPRSWRAC
jgi:predicted acyltransferase